MKYRKFVVLIALLLLVSASQPSPASAASCGYYLDDVYVMCEEESFAVFCADTSRNWGWETYTKTHGEKDYTVWKAGCGSGNSTVITPNYVGDFDIAYYEDGEAFAVYCAAGNYYIYPFPLAYDGDPAPQGVPIDLVVCSASFPYP